MMTLSPISILGLQLCQLFYEEAVRPLLDNHFPDVAHAAALIGPGSEVLGFDDPMSTDHHWGPRLLLFLPDADHQRLATTMHALFAHNLPYEFKGYSTHFTKPDPDDSGTQLLQRIDHRPINHRVDIHTVNGFIAHTLNFDMKQTLTPADWLTFSEQNLRTITAGAVYHDEIGLHTIRTHFAYYPHDVWLYLLAASWGRIGQEEHLMGRAGVVGDEIGSALIGSRLVRDVIRLCFLMERTYAPYPKWLGTAFKQLACADRLWPILQGALQATTWQDREGYLVQAYTIIAKMHNSLKLTKLMPEEPMAFFGRPFQVMAQHGFAKALLAQIHDPIVQQIATLPLIGSLDQLSDNTDLVSYPMWRPLLRQLYQT